MIKAFWILVAVLSLIGSTVAQTSQEAEQKDRNAAMRIARLATLLEPDNPAINSDLGEEHREKVTAEIRAEVTSFVEASVPPSSNQESVEARLRLVLATQKPSVEHGELPRARVATLQYGRSLVLSYTVVRPPHHDSSLIYGFKEDGGAFRRVATTGEDFDGYTMFSFDVTSPLNGELWILVGGRAHTFNGSKYRYRVYSFNGAEFRTIWSLDDVSNATTQVLPNGFSITHIEDQTWRKVTEEYAISANGVFKVK